MIDINTLETYKIFKNDKLLKIELLEKQGLSNKNYLLTSEKSVYLLRILNQQLHINRENEFFNQNLANKKKISAKALYLDEKNSFMICEYLEGFHKSKLMNNDIKYLCESIKILHNIKLSAKEVDLVSLFNFYDKKYLNEIILKQITSVFLSLKSFKKELVFSHNDLNPGNIIFNKGVKFIDWEYSSFNDKYYDLANIVIEFNLDKNQEKNLLLTYFDNVTCDYDKLKVYKIVYVCLSLLWFDEQKVYDKRDNFYEKLLILIET